MRLKVTLEYEYEVDPSNYDDPDPVKMAELDIEDDPAVVLWSENWTIKKATVVGGSAR